MSNNYSYSKVETYNGCPFKYKLQYEDGNYAFTGSIATEFGTAIHESEEAIAKAIQQNKSIDYVSIKNNFILKILKLESKYPVDYAKPDAKSGLTYKQKAFLYLNSGVYRLEKFMLEHPSYRIVGIEQKFKFKYDDAHYFNGAIDRVFFDSSKNTYIIQDIKTYSAPIDKANLATPLQFVIYTLAAKELYACDMNQTICQYDLPLLGITQDGGTKGYISRGIKKLESLFTNIAAQNYAPKPSALCHWCPFCLTNENAEASFKLLCPYFCHWTRDRKDFSTENEWQGLDNHPIVLENFQKRINARV